MLIGVDVDEVVFRHPERLVQWLGRNGFIENEPLVYKALMNKANYDSSVALKEFGVEREDFVKYFHQEDLYDDAMIIDGCESVLNRLIDSHDVVFISSCYSSHLDSKKARLNLLFGNIPFIATSDKEYVSCDWFIDDSRLNCKRYAKRNPESKVLHFQNVFENIPAITDIKNICSVDSWYEVGKFKRLKEI